MADAQTQAQELCAICFDRPGGVVLQPCGHDCFCQQCATRLRACPLCRVPLLPPCYAGDGGGARAQQQPQVASEMELYLFAGAWLLVWVFIFVVGLVEFKSDLPVYCEAGSCELCEISGCSKCTSSYFNSGGKCYETLEELPPVSFGGIVGGANYLALIIAVQVLGCAIEILLIRRLRRAGLLPNKEFIVIMLALTLEVARILLIDLVVLRDYGTVRSYSIFGSPETQDSYYVATRASAYSPDPDVCSTLKASSALLDFGETEGFGGNGYNRFSRLGWILGGQLGLVYFFATFVNEVADIIFVVPTTTAFGWQCKAFSISLEFFQLGALVGPALFTHGDCLQYSNPLNVSLHMIRHIVVVNCFLVWGFVATCIPLALVGGVLVIAVWLWSDLCLSMWGSGRALRVLEEWLARYTQTSAGICVSFLGFAVLPTLFSGIFLSVFVIAGQTSKGGFMDVLTALVLLSDVVFKVTATLVAEATDYALHMRVRRVMDHRRSFAGAVPPEVVGQEGGG